MQIAGNLDEAECCLLLVTYLGKRIGRDIVN